MGDMHMCGVCEWDVGMWGWYVLGEVYVCVGWGVCVWGGEFVCVVVGCVCGGGGCDGGMYG